MSTIEENPITHYPRCACGGCPTLAAERHQDPKYGDYGYCKPCERWRQVPHFSGCKHGLPASVVVSAAFAGCDCTSHVDQDGRVIKRPEPSEEE